MSVAKCHLELMGLPDSAAYRRLARSVLQMACARNLLFGLNVPNKKPGEPLLAWAEVLRQELPNTDLCVHYSLKHQRGQGDSVDLFADFCSKAKSLGIAKVLLVTGPRGPRPDAVQVLEQLSRRQLALGSLKLGVAFNACLPTEQERMAEQQRLVRKLKTGLVQEVWLNCGDDVHLLDTGISFVRATAASLNAATQIPLFGSVLLPNPAQLQQMNERPWNGVHFSQEFLGSLAGMECCTQNVLKLYGRRGVQPIVESKVRSSDDVSRLESLLRLSADAQASVEDVRNKPLAKVDTMHWTKDQSNTYASVEDVGNKPLAKVGTPASDRRPIGQSNTYDPAPRRRWGPGRAKVTVVEEVAVGGRREQN